MHSSSCKSSLTLRSSVATLEKDWTVLYPVSLSKVDVQSINIDPESCLGLLLCTEKFITPCRYQGQLAANFSLFGSISLATHVHVSVHAFICSSTQKWSSFIVSALVLAVQLIKWCMHSSGLEAITWPCWVFIWACSFNFHILALLMTGLYMWLHWLTSITVEAFNLQGLKM